MESNGVRLAKTRMYIDDIVFSNQTLYFQLRPHRQKVGNAPPPSFRNMVVKLLALRPSAIDV